jgi:L-arabinose isomerase
MLLPKIGLLPLYIKLYDDSVPEARERVDAFCDTIARSLAQKSVEVITVPVCRVKAEFEAAIAKFEQENCDAIVTLHLAYSPSLESSGALAATKLPIIVLDTTPTYSYGAAQDPVELMFNHGIHGVQDMCNVLIRNGKDFQIEAGHWEKSDVLERVITWAKAAQIATQMRTAKVGIIGSPFKGMGDFAVPVETLHQKIGVEVVSADPSVLSSLVPGADEACVREEMAADRVAFDLGEVVEEKHTETTRACIAVRRWVENEKLTAFTMNFLELGKSSGLPTVPFMTASKGMANGIGYGGEGDVLTAALVGALASVYPDTTFTEMFCPDWEGKSIFLCHMAEMNINLAVGKPRLREMDFPFTDAENPIIAVGRFKPGEGVLVNLAPGPDDTFSLIVAPVEMLSVKGKDSMANLIHGWFRAEIPVQQFLEEYSRAGGTHHLAFVYGDVVEDLIRFGEIMGWCVRLIGCGSC